MISAAVIPLICSLVVLDAAVRAGDGRRRAAERGRHRALVVTIVGSRGNFCSGVAIGRDLVLTAAHCVQPGADYKIVDYGTQPPRLLDAKSVVSHPNSWSLGS